MHLAYITYYVSYCRNEITSQNFLHVFLYMVLMAVKSSSETCDKKGKLFLGTYLLLSVTRSNKLHRIKEAFLVTSDPRLRIRV